MAPVRARSVRHQEPLAHGGHKRSRPVCHNPRSQGIPTSDLVEWSGETAASNPTDPCRGPAALANEAGVAGVEPRPEVGLVPSQPGPTNVVLADRATTVPFTAVLAGPQRTTTDNTTAAVICADHRSPRWRPRPIWLCKQGVTKQPSASQPCSGFHCSPAQLSMFASEAVVVRKDLPLSSMTIVLRLPSTRRNNSACHSQ